MDHRNRYVQGLSRCSDRQRPLSGPSDWEAWCLQALVSGNNPEFQDWEYLQDSERLADCLHESGVRQ